MTLERDHFYSPGVGVGGEVNLRIQMTLHTALASLPWCGSLGQDAVREGLTPSPRPDSRLPKPPICTPGDKYVHTQ